VTSWAAHAREELEKARAANLLRRTPAMNDPRGPMICVEGRELLNLCHNDYLGLGREPAVIDAACRAARDWGGGAQASRLITGTHRVVADLEEELAEFKGAEAALVFPTGYQANLGLLSALIGREDAVFIDRLAHACLVDGVRLAGARLRVFPHNDTGRLSALLAASAHAPRRWILADGVTSMDGDIAPLPELLALAERHDATVILDDAHATGVIGATGRGTAEHFGISLKDCGERLIIMATLSKALGAQGGAVLGPAILREWLVNTSRPFIYTTGIAPAAAAAAREALAILRREPQRPRRLAALSARIRSEWEAAGLDTMGSETAVIPIRMGDAAAALDASKRLADRGILVLAIRPPTVPKGTSRLRVTANLLATEGEMMAACAAITELAGTNAD